MIIKENSGANGSKEEVKKLCEEYGYKLTKYDEIVLRGKYCCTEIACNNGSISIAAKPNYNYTYSRMEICTLWGKIIDSKSQVKALNEAIELQKKIAALIDAESIS